MLNLGTRIYHKNDKRIMGLIVGSFDSEQGYLMYEILCGKDKWVIPGKFAIIYELPTMKSLSIVSAYKDYNV